MSKPYHTEMRRFGVPAMVACAFLAALALRSLPYTFVFGGEIHFQGFDPWFHKRTVRNLMHHFPHRSEFDPYTAFPTGQPVPTGPLYDLAIGSMAWITGAGSPSDRWVDAVGAWFPAVLGSHVTIPAYFLGAELFGTAAGLVAAWVIALLPGNFLASSLLGFTDHHVAETLFSTLVLLFLVRGMRGRTLLTSILAGVSLGALLGIRPASAFLVAVLMIWVLIQCGLDVRAGRSGWQTWRVVTPALLIGWLLFLPLGAITWAKFTTLALLSGMAGATLAAAVAHALVVRRSQAWFYPASIGIALALLAGSVFVFRPTLITSLARRSCSAPLRDRRKP